MNSTDITFYKKNGYMHFPEMVQLEITLRCPFNCSQCYKEDLDNIDMEYDYLNNMLNLFEKKGVKLITLNGGEPLLYPQIHLVLKKLGHSQIRTNIFSSGKGLDENIINILKEHNNINFFISLNGSSEEINSYSRNGFDSALKAINKLTASGISYGINWVARHDNVCDFPNMLELCTRYKVDFLSITANKLTGKGKIESPVNKEDIEKLASFINNRKDRETTIHIESCFSVLSTLITGNKSGFLAHCYAGISSCTVNCDKTFQPCTHLKIREKSADLEDYWHNSDILKRLRRNPANKLEPCNTCKNRKMCSFCRATTVETYRNFERGLSYCVGYL